MLVVAKKALITQKRSKDSKGKDLRALITQKIEKFWKLKKKKLLKDVDKSGKIFATYEPERIKVLVYTDL